MEIRWTVGLKIAVSEASLRGIKILVHRPHTIINEILCDPCIKILGRAYHLKVPYIIMSTIDNNTDTIDKEQKEELLFACLRLLLL